MTKVVKKNVQYLILLQIAMVSSFLDLYVIIKCTKFKYGLIM